MHKLLYVEDEKWQSQGSISIALTVSYGFEVTNCDDISSAIEKLCSSAFDILLMDIGMNSNNALVFDETSLVILEKVRAGEFVDAGNPEDLPVVFASGVWDMSIQMPDGGRSKVSEVITDLGVKREYCISKPVEMEKLDGALQKALGEVKDDGNS